MSVETIPRSAWTNRKNAWTTPLVPEDVTGIVLHWPGSPSVDTYHGLSQDRIEAVIKGFEDYHINTHGWPGIGYCLLIDWAGRVYEGAGLNKAAHSGTGFKPNPNLWLVGIQWINGMEDEPTKKQVAATHKVIKELKADGYAIGSADVECYGHRTVPLAQSTCPGNKIMKLINSGEFGPPAVEGKSPTVSRKMVSPVLGHVSCEFMGYKGHAGIDIAPPNPSPGSPVFAPFSGIAHHVIIWSVPGNHKSTWAPGRTGNGFLLETPDGMGYGFNHMLPVKGIMENTEIASGQLIGHLDRSGNQTGPHLHFERWTNWRNSNSYTNPRLDFAYHGVKPGSEPKGQSSGTKASNMKLQNQLDAMGYYHGAIDGIPGSMTDQAIFNFQEAFGLATDTIWGSKTNAKAEEVLELRPGKTKLYVDGDEGVSTVVAEQWALRDVGSYTGWVDGDRGTKLMEAWQRYLLDCGYDVGAVDGDYGTRSVEAEQTWLKETAGTYTGAIDGDRGTGTIKALQSAINVKLVKLHKYQEPTAPAPKPTTPAKPSPLPKAETTPESETIETVDPSGFPSVEEFADKVAAELSRRLTGK